MSWEIIIAAVALVFTILGGIWKMASMLGGVQISISRLESDLTSNTNMTKETRDDVRQVSERVAKLEGADEQRQRTYPGIGRVNSR